MSISATRNTILPGFGLPITNAPESLFPTALYYVEENWQRDRITIREYYMMLFMNKLTDKPEWSRKIFDSEICAKWRNEGLSLGILSERCVDWCLKELKHEANLFKESGIVRALDGGVFKADSIIPSTVKEALKKAIIPLEDVPERLKDWHPGSDGKVLDLVHPSLFPLVYGHSRILPEGKVGLNDCIQRMGEGVTIPNPKKPKSTPTSSRWGGAPNLFENAWSDNFQWLPCDVQFEESGNRVKIESYINNLHPHIHKGLYLIIEEILSRMIPLYNQTLTLLRLPQLHRTRISCNGICYPPGLAEHDYPGWHGTLHSDFDGEACDAWLRSRDPIQPEPEGDFTPIGIRYSKHLYYLGWRRTADADGYFSDSHRVDLKRDFFGSGLQVIVKLASIHLTPEKPEYEGGSWHVEGQANEHICATGLYYYDNENITESDLAFRCQVNDNLYSFSYVQNDDSGFEKLFGVSGSFSPAVQDLGDVVTKEDRLITFPNVFQHRVASFRLADPSKPGHRKILAFFLVDPNIRVISTANVPCQQKDWWAHEIRSLPKLPRELFDQIINVGPFLDSVLQLPYPWQDVDGFPISMEEAKMLRERLMDERRIYIQSQDREFHSVEFALCEH